MKRMVVLLVLGMAMVLGLAACSQDSDESSGNADAGSNVPVNNAAENDGTTSEEVETIIADLGDDFDNALSPMGQLALGTLKLDEGDLAVTEEQASELLPLWQALQGLSSSDTTAQVELDAVIKQIQQSMTAQQVAAIAAMRLTGDSLTEMMESGELGFPGFGGRNAGSEGEDGFIPPAGGFGGGPPGGGPPGGGPGGGPGGFGGGFGGQLSEDDIATRRAEFVEGGLEDVGERFLSVAVVRLLQTKTGQAPADRGGPFETVYSVVGEATGLSAEAIQAALEEGQTLAEIIRNNGGDIETVREALIEAFEALPNAGDFDAVELVDRWLSQ